MPWFTLISSLNTVAAPIILSQVATETEIFSPIAGSGLDTGRLGCSYRVMYDVAEEDRFVNELVIGEKRGNQLHVLGREYTAHESDRPTRSESEP